ncbi:MAG: polyprenyl synthetase family protein [Candidatus Bathyarchaeia archaeon]|jgi:geranylgeranyl diphosphate synthase type I
MQSALDIIERYKGTVETELERYLPRSGEPTEFYGSVWELLDRGGKRFRPGLVFLAAESVGGGNEAAIGAAAAVELLHNMTLIHDDIEDESELRRGKPCIHKIYGIPVAINAGDAMLIKVFEIANGSHIPMDRCHKLVTSIAKRAYEITWGQAFEFNLRKRNDFSEEDVIRLIRSKTGALTGLATEAGAIAGGGLDDQIRTLGDFGETIGIAFQIVDDMLNVIGEEKEYGKEIGGDIREGKKTVMAAHLLKTATAADRKMFLRMLGKKSIKRTEIKKAINLYQEYGSIDYAKAQSSVYLQKAIEILNKLPLSRARQNLELVAKFLVSRNY